MLSISTMHPLFDNLALSRGNSFEIADDGGCIRLTPLGGPSGLRGARSKPVFARPRSADMLPRGSSETEFLGQERAVRVVDQADCQ